MNYKKIFRSPAARAAVLNCLRFVPDATMLKLQYWIKTGRSLNLKNPRRYTEKLQWYKLHYRNPIMRRCVDKYEVRGYVAEKGLDEILVPLYGKYRSVEEIDWNALPDSFVIKSTNGSGGLNVALCRDKKELDVAKLKKSLVGQKIASRTGGREWAYYGLEHGIVVEELLVNEENPEAGVNDYKIFCYNGKPRYIIVDVDRYIGHKRNFYDENWNRIEAASDCPPAESDVPKPKNFDKMLEIAAKLSEGFPYLRVDLYNLDGKIYFGELTFYPWSGYVQFDPDELDFKFGEPFALEKYVAR